MDQLGFSTLLHWRSGGTNHVAYRLEDELPLVSRVRYRDRLRRLAYAVSWSGKPNGGNTAESRNASTATI
jgi:hypothetical protein